jgi:hypothetical protein
VPPALGAGAELATPQEAPVEVLEQFNVELAFCHRAEGRLEIDPDEVGVALGSAGLVPRDLLRLLEQLAECDPGPRVALLVDLGLEVEESGLRPPS